MSDDPSRKTYLAQRLIEWHQQSGRHDLPWQTQAGDTPDPYKVWVSEIMLQQTQVTTVIDYFTRFMVRFPDVASLASAQVDDVLHHWTGLGYYARARNLHKAANLIVNDHGGEFPDTLEAAVALPGVGRSTAGAVLSFCYGQRQPILDGNVKRVLARYYRVVGWTGSTAVAQRLWSMADYNTPVMQTATYTQAIMDLGATVCARKPACNTCPLKGRCRAHRYGDSHRLPTPKPRKALPTKSTTMLMLSDEDGRYLLERRPSSGIWGGLWGFPEVPELVDADNQAIFDWCRRRLGLTPSLSGQAQLRGQSLEPLSRQAQLQGQALERWPVVRHTFSHYHLNIHPIRVPVRLVETAVMESAERLWYNLSQPQSLGFAAPVVKLLTALESVDDPNGLLRQT